MPYPVSYNNRYSGPMAWTRQSLCSNNQWRVELNAEHTTNIKTLIDATRSKPIAALTARDFDHYNLTPLLLSLRNEILNGRGFVVISGLPAHWTDEELVRAHWGIGLWLGEPVSQNAKAHLLGHVIDQRGKPSGDTRIYQTNRAQPFHSDSCDIVGLLCLRKAKTGGASAVASSASIYNTLFEDNPELLSVLCSDFQCDRYGEIPAGKQPWYSVRVFNHIDDNLVCCGMDPDIRSAQRLDGVRPLTELQIAALDAFQQVARDAALNMLLERGDLQFVNNHVIVHARGSFEDHKALSRRRYMVRLWLSSPLGRVLPPFLSERWGNIEAGTKRGGIMVPGATPIVHLDPDR